jgi:hypothetical protein
MVEHKVAGLLPHARAVGVLASLGCGAAAIYFYRGLALRAEPWWWLLVSLVLAALCSIRLPVSDVDVGLRSVPATGWRAMCGWLLVAGGAAAFGYATKVLYSTWQTNFDFAWLSWLGGGLLIGFGLDLIWGRGPRRAEPLVGRVDLFLMLAILLIASIYRLYGLATKPGEGAVTQVEELQVGNWATAFLNGDRGRWEFIGHVWLAAVGMWLHGASLYGMRFGFAVISALKVIPLYVWLRCTVGRSGAIVAALLLACAGWDIVLARIPTNHDTFTVALVFALLAWPVREGRPSGYVALGVLGGYLLFQYIPYRPAILLIVAGACAFSWLDRSVGIVWRVARPMVTLLLITGMAVPLFLSRLEGRFLDEYLNGWNRAHAVSSYYDPTDSWKQVAQKRADRTIEGISLFFFNGDRSQARNVGNRPLLDPLAGVLFLLGFGYALVNVSSGLTGLLLVGFVVTFVGTLVATGNMDVVRIGSAVSYVYVLVGYGAAAVSRVVRRAWGRTGSVVTMMFFSVALVAVACENARFLSDLWSNRATQRAVRSNLALLSSWLRENVREQEQVVGIAPGYSHVLVPNDAAWLRGRQIPGKVSPDVAGALGYWKAHDGQTLLFVFAGRGTSAVRSYLEWTFPELKLQWQPDPLNAGGEIAYAHLEAAPPGLGERLARLDCRGVRAEFDLIGAPARTPVSFKTVLPFVDCSTWPGVLRETVFQSPSRPQGIRVRLESTFRIEQPGPYSFALESYAGSAEISVDSDSAWLRARAPLQLDAGEHTLKVRGNFEPLGAEPALRLSWKGPDTGGVEEVMPFYRLAVESTGCSVPEHVDRVTEHGVTNKNG